MDTKIVGGWLVLDNYRIKLDAIQSYSDYGIYLYIQSGNEVKKIYTGLIARDIAERLDEYFLNPGPAPGGQVHPDWMFVKRPVTAAEKAALIGQIEADFSRRVFPAGGHEVNVALTTQAATPSVEDVVCGERSERRAAD